MSDKLGEYRLYVAPPSDRTMTQVGTDILQKGWIVSASIGSYGTNTDLGPIWAAILLTTYNAVPAPALMTIAAGYICSGMFPLWEGRLPVLINDQLIMRAFTRTGGVSLIGLIRFERGE